MTKFCADIHNNLSLTLTTQGIKVGPCCWYQIRHVNTSYNKNFWNIPALIELREVNKQERLNPIGCSQCIGMEANGGVSRRTGINDYYNSSATDLSGPRGLDISIDYTCNLACIMCGPNISTQWRLELKTPKNIFPTRMSESDIIAILDQIDLSNLDNIHFYGGDPLVTLTHEIILDYLDKRIGLSKLYVWYHTNGTIRVPQRVFDLWDKCRLIKLFFSIDDVGDRFDYIRYGANWKQVEDNMLWYKETSPTNVMFSLEPTLNCLNSYYHHDLITWKNKNFNTNRLGDFIDIVRHNAFNKFELNAMPDELRLNSIKNNQEDTWFGEFVSSFGYDATKYNATCDLIKEIDARRGCNFAKTFPELTDYFDTHQHK